LLRCIYCEQELISQQPDAGYLCKDCRALFNCDNGIYNFLRDDSEVQEFFPENSFDHLFKLEGDNFWFFGRNLLIKYLISNYLPINSTILEIGCGTGFVASYLRKIGYVYTDCSDVFYSAIRYCRERDAGHSYYLFDLQYCPFFEHYDAVCVFDVLEHIHDDKKALTNLYNSIRERGFLFITVPANNLLWSKMDVYAMHKRRYSREELIQKVERAGFNIVRCSYFMSLLFPLLFLRKVIWANSSRDTAITELKLNPLLNKIFFSIFAIELLLLKRKNLSFGSSLFCVAQKKAKHD
jgi:SAM-dependent methyltransferase